MQFTLTLETGKISQNKALQQFTQYRTFKTREEAVDFYEWYLEEKISLREEEIERLQAKLNKFLTREECIEEAKQQRRKRDEG